MGIWLKIFRLKQRFDAKIVFCMQTRGLCKACQAFTCIAMILAELAYRHGIDRHQNQMPTWIHTFMLFISSFINLLQPLISDYFFELDIFEVLVKIVVFTFCCLCLLLRVNQRRCQC